jgi:hypothetical protein
MINQGARKGRAEKTMVNQGARKERAEKTMVNQGARKGRAEKTMVNQGARKRRAEKTMINQGARKGRAAPVSFKTPTVLTYIVKSGSLLKATCTIIVSCNHLCIRLSSSGSLRGKNVWSPI